MRVITTEGQNAFAPDICFGKFRACDRCLLIARVARLWVIEVLNALVIRLRSVQVEVQKKLAAYLLCIHNSNLEIRIVVSFGPPQ